VPCYFVGMGEKSMQDVPEATLTIRSQSHSTGVNAAPPHQRDLRETVPEGYLGDLAFLLHLFESLG
jgi:hypothetical protein